MDTDEERMMIVYAEKKRTLIEAGIVRDNRQTLGIPDGEPALEGRPNQLPILAAGINV